MTSSDIKLSAQQPAESGVDWRLFGILMFAALLSSLAVVPYLIEIIQATGKQVVAWELAVATVSEHLMLSAIAIGIGLSLGPHVNLKTPLLSKILSGEPGWLMAVVMLRSRPSPAASDFAFLADTC